MKDGNSQVETPVKAESMRKRNPISSAVRAFTFASIGAVSIGREESTRLLHRLVERGESDVNHARKSFRRARTKRHELEKRVLQRNSGTLSAESSLPTRSEMDALREQLVKLNHELAELHSSETTPKATAD